VGRGEVQPFDGDLDDYQKYLLDEAKRLRELAKSDAAAAAPPPAPTAAPQQQRKADAQQRQQLAARTKPLKRELGQAESRMAQLQADKQALEARLAGALPPAELAEAGRRLKAVNDELQALEERWLGLSAQIEALETSA
jgi:ATP-binding cassette subfamily F protein 3